MNEKLTQICNEALTCRKDVVAFNLSYFGKFYLTGKDAQKTVEWICTADTNVPINELVLLFSTSVLSIIRNIFHSKIVFRFNRTVYTCALNGRGGVESVFMITKIESGSGQITNPKFDVSQLEFISFLFVAVHVAYAMSLR